MADLVASFTRESEQLLRDGIGRDGFLGRFAIAWLIGQLAGAAEEPFAGLIE